MTLTSIATHGGYDIPAILGEPDLGEPRGTVIMAHGIFSTKEESGRYPRQAALHHAAGWRTIRFDWQGHGEHPVSFADSTVGGYLDDLESVSTFVKGTFGGPLRIVASSFGASILLLRELSGRPSFERNVLLNPVTDYKHTFDGPATGQLEAAFAPHRWEEAMSQGSVVLAPGKVLSRRMAFELKTLEPFRAFQTLNAPTLVIHGTADATVDFELTRRNATVANDLEFIPIEGADHAFGFPWEEEASFNIIQNWLYGTKSD